MQKVPFLKLLEKSTTTKLFSTVGYLITLHNKTLLTRGSAFLCLIYKKFMSIEQLFDRPKIIGVIGDTNTGKSNLLYFMIQELLAKFTFNLYSYGLRIDVGEQKVYSLCEIETLRDSVIVIDEFFTLFDLEDRKARRSIEQSIRLINHNNNILVLCGLPDNYKKFIASVLDVAIFKKCTLEQFINGSKTKSICLSYKGQERGSAVLDIDKDRAIVFDGHFENIEVPYIKDKDTKRANTKILKDKVENVTNNVQIAFQKI